MPDLGDPFENTNAYMHATRPKSDLHLDILLNNKALSSLIDEAPQTNKLGTLDVLPAELLVKILKDYLPVEDLMRFRCCSRSSSHFVDTIPQFQQILQFAPNILKAFMVVRLNYHVSVEQLHCKLAQRFCERCCRGAMAQYIYLPTFERNCLNCIFDRPHPVCEEIALRLTRLSPDALALLPRFRSLSATFTKGHDKFKVEKGHWFYSQCRPTDKGAQVYASTFHEYAMAARNTSLQMRISGCLAMQICVVFAPWTDPTYFYARQGMFCSRCMYSKEDDTLHTQEAFSAHLKDCISPNFGVFERNREEELSAFERRFYLTDNTE